ncbi:MAG: PAS domain S-box protein [Chitinophagales bacterium]
MITTLETRTAKSSNESFASHFLKMSPDIMVIVGLDGEINFFNDTWEHVSGFSRKELEKNSLWSLTHPEDLVKVKSELQRVRDGEEQQQSNYESRIICKNGDVKYFAWSSNIDRINGLIYAIGRDVTELHHQNQALLDNEQKFEFISDNSFEGVCIYTEGKLQLANQAFYKMFGYKNETAVINKNFLDFIADNDLKNIKQLEKKKFEGVFETKGKTKNGDYFAIELQVKNILYKNQDARIASIRDITEKRAVLEKITKSENLYHSVFQNQAVGLLLTDIHGKSISVNSQLLHKVGYTEEEFLSLPLSAILHASEIDDVKKTLTEIVKNKTVSKRKERRFVKKDGSSLWLNCTSSSITPEDGDELIMIVFEDVDQKKKLEVEMQQISEKIKAVYDGSPMGIVVTRHPGIIVDVNTAFVEMLGYSREELLDNNILGFTHPSDISRSEKMIDKVYHEKLTIHAYEKKYLKKDGSTLWARTVVSQMSAGENDIIAVAFIEDIENKKRTEETLEIKNKELLHTNQELEHFAYVASHDLQEPLRTITSFIQILEKRYKKNLDEDGQQFMSYVVEGAKRMQNLIRDLLEYSRINRFNTSYEQVDLNEVFHTMNRVLKDKIDSNDAIILAEHLPVVQGNKLQITQLFQNLVDNAIKFRGKKKPEIEINVTEHADKWEFAFKDNGIGISNEYYQRIFVIFQRLHTHEEYTGTGIGLAICKKIIERHGGEVWVDSKPGKGTTFYFTIAKNLTSPVGSMG